jgi:hypothetical protein
MAQDAKRAILLNGPPSSGKDLSAIIIRNMLYEKADSTSLPFRPVIMKFADPLKAAAHQILNIPYSCEHFEKIHGNIWKNEPQVEFFGKTPRSEYIALSEEYLKPRHGKDIFGRIMARRMQLHKGIATFIIPDSGFWEEAVPVIKYLGLDNVCVIQLNRPNCSFVGDSRGYIVDDLKAQYPGLRHITLPNNGDQAFLTNLLKGTMGKFLKYIPEF